MVSFVPFFLTGPILFFVAFFCGLLTNFSSSTDVMKRWKNPSIVLFIVREVYQVIRLGERNQVESRIGNIDGTIILGDAGPGCARVKREESGSLHVTAAAFFKSIIE